MTAVASTRPEWLDARRNGIGASDAAAIFGLHPYVSALALYWDKTGELVTDDDPTEAMEWGTRLEPVVAAAWSEKTGKQLLRFGLYDPDAIVAHPEYPWMIASLDGIVLDDADGWEAVYEGKTCSAWAADDWENDGVPYYVVVQVHHQMAVTGLRRAHIACLIGGSKFVQTTVDRDDELIESLIVAEKHFWRRIQDRQPPPPDSHPNTTEALKARWEDTLAEAVDLGLDGGRLVNLRHQQKAAAKEAADALVETENRLRMLMGENEVGLVEGVVAVTWKPNKNGQRTLIVKEI